MSSWGQEQLQAAFTEFKIQDLCRCLKTSHDHPTSCIKSQRNYFEVTSLQQVINSVTTIRDKYCPAIISSRYVGTAFCNTLRGCGPVTRQTVRQMNHRFWSCVLYDSACRQLLYLGTASWIAFFYCFLSESRQALNLDTDCHTQQVSYDS
jgi:hypothetical protein